MCTLNPYIFKPMYIYIYIQREREIYIYRDYSGYIQSEICILLV